MTRALTLLHMLMQMGRSPSQLLSAFNQTLSQQNPKCLFVTAFVACYDPSSGKLTYANAGHNPPYVISDTPFPLESHDMAAGVFPDLDYAENEVTLRGGDLLLMYTDGVTEAEYRDGAFYGTEALERVAGRCRGGHAGQALASVLRDVRAFCGDAEQSDDLTILMMEARDAFPAPLPYCSPN